MHVELITFNMSNINRYFSTDVFAWFRISFMWFATIGTVSCVLLGVIVSLITGIIRSSLIKDHLPKFDGNHIKLSHAYKTFNNK